MLIAARRGPRVGQPGAGRVPRGEVVSSQFLTGPRRLAADEKRLSFLDLTPILYRLFSY
jgi:hypothetical protein